MGGRLGALAPHIRPERRRGRVPHAHSPRPGKKEPSPWTDRTSVPSHPKGLHGLPGAVRSRPTGGGAPIIVATFGADLISATGGPRLFDGRAKPQVAWAVGRPGPASFTYEDL